MMATATTSSLSLSTSSALNVTSRQSPSASPQCVSLPTLPPPPVQSQIRVSRTSAYCLKIARNVKAMATGDGPAAATVSVTEPASTPAPTPTPTPASTEVDDGETPEFLKTVQQAWDKVEDKYAVSSLAVAGTLALVASSGVISAIDKLPLIPGVLELVGIGYTGWFAYKNLIFTPEREALIKKVKDTYNEIIGSS